MSGKPAARQGDMTQYGGPIVQGSAGVRIGAPAPPDKTIPGLSDVPRGTLLAVLPVLWRC